MLLEAWRNMERRAAAAANIPGDALGWNQGLSLTRCNMERNTAAAAGIPSDPLGWNQGRSLTQCKCVGQHGMPGGSHCVLSGVRFRVQGLGFRT